MFIIDYYTCEIKFHLDKNEFYLNCEDMSAHYRTVTQLPYQSYL